MYKVGIIGCGRMAGTIDDEVPDYPSIVLPYCHAGAYREVPETQLWCAADVNEARLKSFGARWGVDRLYTDYREMLEKENPDIVSVTTQAIQRARILLDVVEHGVKGIYSEKALACSLAESDAIGEAVRRRGVPLVYGALRRYNPAYQAVRQVIESGEIGAAKTALGVGWGALLHTHSHTIDTCLYWLGDPEPDYVQATLVYQGPGEERERLTNLEKDPSLASGYVHFQSGQEMQIIGAPQAYEFSVYCERGSAHAWNNGSVWHLRELDPGSPRRSFQRDREFPSYPRQSSTVNVVRDLVSAIAKGTPTRSSIETAQKGMEIALGFLESHAQGGVRVKLPLENRTRYIASR